MGDLIRMRTGCAVSEAWVRAAERLLDHADRDGFARALLGCLGELVAFDRGLLYVVRRDTPPWILYDQSGAHPARQRETRVYLEGGYLLDPYYRAFLEGAPACFYTDAPDAANAPEWAGLQHVAFLAPVSDADCLVLLLLREEHRPLFSGAELGRYRAVQGAVGAALRLHWRSYAATRVERRLPVPPEGLHERVEAALDRFGAESLTPREAEVVRLLLRGSSTRAAAEQLGIAPATAALHRKRAYAKLGVRSQAQLFYHFICSLSAASGVETRFDSFQVPRPRAVSVGP